MLQPRRGFRAEPVTSRHPTNPNRAAIQGRDSGVGCKRCYVAPLQPLLPPANRSISTQTLTDCASSVWLGCLQYVPVRVSFASLPHTELRSLSPPHPVALSKCISPKHRVSGATTAKCDADSLETMLVMALSLAVRISNCLLIHLVAFPNTIDS